MHPRLRNLLLAKPLLTKLLLTTWALLPLGLTPAAAGPEGGTVVGGAATIQGQGGASVIINQSSSSAIINWNTFNIRANESVRFNQPSSSSVSVYPRDRRPRPVGDHGHVDRQRPGVRHQPRRHPVRPRQHGEHGGLRPPPMTSRTRTSWPGANTSTFRAGRMRRSSTRERSRRRAAALPRWWRQACATPGPSPPRSAPWRSRPATASTPTCTATS